MDSCLVPRGQLASTAPPVPLVSPVPQAPMAQALLSHSPSSPLWLNAGASRVRLALLELPALLARRVALARREMLAWTGPLGLC
jgi:hypothetical protein